MGRLGDRFRAGVVIYTGADTIPFGERLWAVPVSGLWNRRAGQVAGTPRHRPPQQRKLGCANAAVLVSERRRRALPVDE